MKKVHIQLIYSDYCTDEQEPMHGKHFRQFVQMMLCHAWSVGLLETKLWSDIPDIAEAAVLHDIGKNALPHRIISKKGGLTAGEYMEMQQHTLFGASCLEVLAPQLRNWKIDSYARTICFLHHERVNGRGYPQGLCGNEIPVYVQVISLADVYDALRTDRSYREAFLPEKAVKMIYEEKCGAFDPDLFDAFAPLLEQFWQLAHRMSENAD